MAELDMGPVASVVCEVIEERRRQFAKFGDQSHLPDGTGGELTRLLAGRAREVTDAAAKAGELTFRLILREEVFEAFAETDPVRLRAELIQVEAVANQWIEAIDRRGGR